MQISSKYESKKTFKINNSNKSLDKILNKNNEKKFIEKSLFNPRTNKFNKEQMKNDKENYYREFPMKPSITNSFMKKTKTLANHNQNSFSKNTLNLISENIKKNSIILNNPKDFYSNLFNSVINKGDYKNNFFNRLQNIAKIIETKKGSNVNNTNSNIYPNKIFTQNTMN